MAKLAGSFDTNVLLRLLLNDVPDQHQAVVTLLHDHSHQFAVADVAIIEVVFVLNRYYQFSRVAIAEALEGLIALPQINCNRALIEKTLPLYINSPKLSFEDCCLAVYADLNEALPLWTFDQKLSNQAPGVKLVPII